MSFMAKIAAGAATFALAGGGLGMAGTVSASASAKTPSCRANCNSWYTQKFGPSFVLDVLHGQASTGNGVILFQASNNDPAEDFYTNYIGTVDSLFTHTQNLISPGMDETYGSDQAIEIQYEPRGVNSNFCLGTWPGEAARPGFKVRLETCGQTSTIFVVDQADTNGDYMPLIAGTDTNFSNPLVLNYPRGNPTDMPRPWLNVQPLSSFSTGDVYDSQLWDFSPHPMP